MSDTNNPEVSRNNDADKLDIIFLGISALIVVLVIGCLCAAYKSYIKKYMSNFSSAFSSTFGTTDVSGTQQSGQAGPAGQSSASNIGLTKADRFTIPLIDETDMKYIKAIVPQETLEGVAKDISDVDYVSDPNAQIDNKDLLTSSQYNYGPDMPWDRDVSPCEVLKNTDQDLYADVQDSKSIIIY